MSDKFKETIIDKNSSEKTTEDCSSSTVSENAQENTLINNLNDPLVETENNLTPNQKLDSSNGNNISKKEGEDLGAEERKKRRQELIEKQKKASLNSDNSQFPPLKKINVPSEAVNKNDEKVSLALSDSSNVRFNLVNEAVEFLKDPKLAEYSPENKVSFLTSKGLTQDEIQLALKESSTKNISLKDLKTISHSPPPLPPRLHLQKEQNSLPISLLAKQIGFLVLLSSGITCALFFAFKKYALPLLFKIFNARRWILKNRKRQYQNLENECADIETFQNFDIVTEPGTNSIIVEQNSSEEKNSLILSSILTKSDDVTNSVNSMNTQRNKGVGRTSNLIKEISSLFSFYLNQIPEPSRDPSVWSRSDSPAASLKSEIRSLKGILLRTSSKFI